MNFKKDLLNDIYLYYLFLLCKILKKVKLIYSEKY